MREILGPTFCAMHLQHEPAGPGEIRIDEDRPCGVAKPLDGLPSTVKMPDHKLFDRRLPFLEAHASITPFVILEPERPRREGAAWALPIGGRSVRVSSLSNERIKVLPQSDPRSS